MTTAAKPAGQGQRHKRRSREAPSSSASGGVDEGLPPSEYYNALGDSAAALEALEEDAPLGTAKHYNRLLLSHVVVARPAKEEASPAAAAASETPAATSQAFLQELADFEKAYRQRKDNLSTRKRRRNDMILTYNKGLVLFTHGDAKFCLELCANSLAGFLDRRQKPAEDLAEVCSRTAFLMFECLLHLATGRRSATEIQKSLNLPVMADVLAWLDTFDTDRDPQLKFQLSLYKTRLELAERKDHAKFDARIRSSRKEVKSAMEVFQQKLRSAYGADSASVVSSANSEENMSAASTSYQEASNNNQPHQPQQAMGSIVLQRFNQSALNLKAGLETMKGNVKKSLILCSEAYSAAVDNTDYEAIHSNNLGLVYETNDKCHLALHVLSKGLQRSTASTFKQDGTASPSQTLPILYNSALCALRAGNHIAAYECMASCISQSSAFDNPTCWLRMAEACLGVYHSLDSKTNRHNIKIIESNGEPRGLVLGRSEVSEESLVEVIASPEDLEQIGRVPALRARYCLERVIQFNPEEFILLSARLSLAFTLLALREYRKALEEARKVIDAREPKLDPNDVALRVHKRRVATARLYAAEASCAIGGTAQARHFLLGDGKGDSIDRLASDLGGVTLETAAANGKGKRRLARAQTMVRSSLSAATAAMGNSTAAKQLAMQAQAMEDSYESNREKSSARRALVYCLLREGNHAAALSLLQSMRNA